LYHREQTTMPMPIGFSDEELRLITAMTQPLQPSQRSAFLRALVDELRLAPAAWRCWRRSGRASSHTSSKGH
jgi:hypothetical protein